MLAVCFTVFCSFDPAFAQIERVEIDEFDTAETRNVISFTPPPSGQIYSLFQGQNREVLRLFEISSSGVVSVKGPLIYTRGETNIYDVIVVQRIIGETTGGKARTLKVTVRDRNNFSPTFPKSIYYGFVREGSPENVVVQGLGDCYAEDRDSFGIDKYSIVFGNEKGYFKIETRNLGSDNSRKFLVLKTTGTKIVRDPSTPNIMLTVRASDRSPIGGDSIRDAETKILVTVEDKNENKPVFQENQYDVTISEDTPVMTSILEVRATDLDDGRNGGVYYYLNPLSDHFSVDPITGAIRVVRVLNYQTKKDYDLTVVASDRGRPSLKGSTNVKITLQDMINYPPAPPTIVQPNSPPTFPDGPYNFRVREDFPVGAAILIIRSLDKEREQLRYTLIGGSGVFKLDQWSGVLTLERTLDYESGQKVYKMEVAVRDSSNTQVKTKLDIEVQDVDENHNSPVFDANTIQKVASVKEDQSAGSSVTTVTATDSDSGSDGQLVYTITGGTGLGVFAIDSSTGAVTTVTPLNREVRSTYKLIVNATDKAVFPRTASMFLIIDIADDDDNYPEFTQPIYIATVPEKQPSETFVTVVQANDRDGQAVSYGVTNSNFKMESTTGVIRTTRLFDAGVNPSFELEVTASAGSLTSKAQVNVTVTTKQDAPPKFTKDPPTYGVVLPENEGAVPNLMCIAAVDNTNTPVIYSITTGADDRIKLDPNNGMCITLFKHALVLNIQILL